MYPTAWEVSGLNLAEGKILSEPKRRFIAQSLSLSWYDWNTVERDVKLQVIVITTYKTVTKKSWSFIFFLTHYHFNLTIWLNLQENVKSSLCVLTFQRLLSELKGFNAEIKTIALN